MFNLFLISLSFMLNNFLDVAIEVLIFESWWSPNMFGSGKIIDPSLSSYWIKEFSDFKMLKSVPKKYFLDWLFFKAFSIFDVIFLSSCLLTNIFEFNRFAVFSWIIPSM